MMISLDLGIRMYKDRVSGLIAGLWRSGVPERILLLLFVAGLLSPIIHAAAMWGGRRLHPRREARLERRREADAPRRLDALRLTRLATLPAERLEALAREASWLHPRQGTEILSAGQALPGVFAVVDGALEARRPGDPPGTVRDRATAGQLVGTTSTLTGTASPLCWRTAGTRLLLLPRRAFVAAVGPFAEALAARSAEAGALLDDSPAFAALGDDERAAFLASMTGADLDPGDVITASRPGDAAVVASGVLGAGGAELRRGDLIGPATDNTMPSATARSRARLWWLPAVAELGIAPMGLAGARHAQRAPDVGVHGTGSYPPLVGAAGPPPAGNDEVDRRLGRWFRRLLLLLLLLLVLATVAVLPPAGYGPRFQPIGPL